MRFPTYQAAVGYIAAWAGEHAYTISVVPPDKVADDNARCIEDVSEQDAAWANAAWDQTAEDDYSDVTLSLETGDAQLGYILVFYDQRSNIAKVFGYSCYY